MSTATLVVVCNDLTASGIDVSNPSRRRQQVREAVQRHRAA